MAVRTRTTYRMSVELQEDTFVELYRDTFAFCGAARARDTFNSWVDGH